MSVPRHTLSRAHATTRMYGFIIWYFTYIEYAAYESRIRAVVRVRPRTMFRVQYILLLEYVLCEPKQKTIRG